MIESIIIVALLVFGGSQYVAKEKAQDDNARLTEQLRDAVATTEKALGVNETNVDTIVKIDSALTQCRGVVQEYKALERAFAIDNQSDQSDIEALESTVNSYDWANQRIPDGLLDATAED